MICVPRKVDGGYIGELYQGPPYKTCAASGWIIPGTDLTSSLIDMRSLNWIVFPSIDDIKRATTIPVFEELPNG